PFSVTPLMPSEVKLEMNKYFAMPPPLSERESVQLPCVGSKNLGLGSFIEPRNRLAYLVDDTVVVLGMRVIRRPHDAIGAEELRAGGEVPFLGLETHPALPLEVLTRKHREPALLERERLDLFVHALQLGGHPPPARFEEHDAQLREAFADAAHQQAAEA